MQRITSPTPTDDECRRDTHMLQLHICLKPHAKWCDFIGQLNTICAMHLGGKAAVLCIIEIQPEGLLLAHNRTRAFKRIIVQHGSSP